MATGLWTSFLPVCPVKCYKTFFVILSHIGLLWPTLVQVRVKRTCLLLKKVFVTFKGLPWLGSDPGIFLFSVHFRMLPVSHSHPYTLNEICNLRFVTKNKNIPGSLPRLNKPLKVTNTFSHNKLVCFMIMHVYLFYKYVTRSSYGSHNTFYAMK